MNILIKQTIRQFMPIIQEKALPAVEALLDDIVQNTPLNPGEDSAAFVLQKYKPTGEWWAYVVTLSPDNYIIRTIKQMRLQDIISQALNTINQQ